MIFDKPQFLKQFKAQLRESDARKQMQNPANVTTSLFGDKVIDGLVLFQPLLYVDEKIDAVNHALDELHLREAETVRIGDVKCAAHGCCVNTA